MPLAYLDLQVECSHLQGVVPHQDIAAFMASVTGPQLLYLTQKLVPKKAEQGCKPNRSLFSLTETRYEVRGTPLR